jgi:hypothetical protein
MELPLARHMLAVPGLPPPPITGSPVCSGWGRSGRVRQCQIGSDCVGHQSGPCSGVCLDLNLKYCQPNRPQLSVLYFREQPGGGITYTTPMTAEGNLLSRSANFLGGGVRWSRSKLSERQENESLTMPASIGLIANGKYTANDRKT